MCICEDDISLFLVSFTGREFFVGLSKRTNQRGAEILADAFKVSVNDRTEAQMWKRPQSLSAKWVKIDEFREIRNSQMSSEQKKTG